MDTMRDLRLTCFDHKNISLCDLFLSRRYLVETDRDDLPELIVRTRLTHSLQIGFASVFLEKTTGGCHGIRTSQDSASFSPRDDRNVEFIAHTGMATTR